MQDEFKSFFENKYLQLDGIPLGRPQHAENIYNEYEIKIPVSVLNRHGLITGSTGTGKSRVIQLIIEKLSELGIATFLSDIKGDMSGFILPGDATKVATRAQKLSYQFTPKTFATNYWGNEKGLINFRINLSDADYLLLAKLLELNATQESHLGAIFKYARDQRIEINNLHNLVELITYLVKYPEKSLGTSTNSLNVVLRKINNIEYNQLDELFGEPAVNVENFLDDKISILWLQNNQHLAHNVGSFVSFFLYKLYKDLPEVGNTTKPKLVVFIDEAHQIFENANPKLVDLIVSILKKIRSKGVGVFFNTQNADDIPEKILEQLGLKIQFALRAFSKKELEDIKGAVDSFPETKLYNLKEEIKSLQTGTAFISTLNEAGELLPPVKTVIYPPASFMDAVPLDSIRAAGEQSLKDWYSQEQTTKKLDLGTPLDSISVSRGGKWQMSTFAKRKEEQAVARAVRKRNKDIKHFLILLITILVLVVAVMLLAIFFLQSIFT